MIGSMYFFKRWRDLMGLVDLFLMGRKFIRVRLNVVSKIDRVFVDLDWFLKFLDLKILGFKYVIFDYCLILIEIRKENWGFILLRSLDIWFFYLKFIKNG